MHKANRRSVPERLVQTDQRDPSSKLSRRDAKGPLSRKRNRAWGGLARAGRVTADHLGPPTEFRADAAGARPVSEP